MWEKEVSRAGGGAGGEGGGERCINGGSQHSLILSFFSAFLESPSARLRAQV